MSRPQTALPIYIYDLLYSKIYLIPVDNACVVRKYHYAGKARKPSHSLLQMIFRILDHHVNFRV